MFHCRTKINKMSNQFEKLSPEVEAYILDYLCREEFLALQCTSKRFYDVTAPRLWTEIELHRPGLHEDALFQETFDYDAIFLLESNRKYIRSSIQTREDSRQVDLEYMWMAKRFLNIFSPPLDTNFGLVNPEHRKQVAARIRSLCLSLEPESDEPGSQDCLSVFSQFQNLESLQISFDERRRGDKENWDASNLAFISNRRKLKPLTKLRDLRLRGYAPAAFVQWACHGASDLLQLELAILDRPVGVFTNEDYDFLEQAGQLLMANEDDTLVRESASEPERENQEWDGPEPMIAPRPLAVFSDTDIPKSFTSVSTLILRRPTECSIYENTDRPPHEKPFVSARSDEAVLNEWARIIRTAQTSIEHLILDQRPIAAAQEQDAMGHVELMVAFPYGPGYRRFEKIVLPILLEDVEWPKLRSIRLYGFDLPEHESQKGSGLPRTFEKRSFLRQLRDRFAGSGVDLGIGLSRLMQFTDDDGTIRIGGDGFGKNCFCSLEDGCCG